MNHQRLPGPVVPCQCPTILHWRLAAACMVARMCAGRAKSNRGAKASCRAPQTVHDAGIELDAVGERARRAPRPPRRAGGRVHARPRGRARQASASQPSGGGTHPRRRTPPGRAPERTPTRPSLRRLGPPESAQTLGQRLDHQGQRHSPCGRDPFRRSAGGCPGGSADEHRRVVGRLARRVERPGCREPPAFAAQPVAHPVGRDRRADVDQDRVAIGRNADRERVGGEDGVAPAERRDARDRRVGTGEGCISPRSVAPGRNAARQPMWWLRRIDDRGDTVASGALAPRASIALAR